MTHAEEGGGLGLGEFLGHDPDAEKIGGFTRDRLTGWKEKGEVVVWLHTRAPIIPSWGHVFMEEGEAKDKDKPGKMKKFLRFPRYNSPDPAKVHVNQYFREKKGALEGVLSILAEPPPPKGNGVLSMADPFLVLREWLRWEAIAKRLSEEAVVFEWTDWGDRNALVQWQVGELSGLEKRGKRNWNHSIDSKKSYFMAVVQHAKLGDGPLIAIESSSLGDAVRQVIKDQIESRGDEDGDPTKNPYAIKLKYNKDADPKDMYSALRFDQAKYTEEVWEAIDQTTPPDVADAATFKRDDLLKIRASMTAAMQMDLPLDDVFSPDPDVRAAILLGKHQGRAQTRTTTSGSGGGSGAAQRPPATPGAARPPSGASGAAKPSGGAQAAPPASAPGGRRRMLKEEAPPEPAPPPSEPEMIPCDRCQTPMLATASTCPKCGAKYEIEGEEPPPPKTEQQPRSRSEARAAGAGASAAPAPSGGGAKRPGGAAAPPPKAEAPPSEQGGEGDGEGVEQHAGPPAKCWACGAPDIVKKGEKYACAGCGVEQSDDIPFDRAPGEVSSGA